MKLHILKIKYEYFMDIGCGRKTFELRKNDRDYKVGDLIHFVDVNEQKNKSKPHNMLSMIDYDNVYVIDYILTDVPEYGLDKDYCILGIKKLR